MDYMKSLVAKQTSRFRMYSIVHPPAPAEMLASDLLALYE